MARSRAERIGSVIFLIAGAAVLVQILMKGGVGFYGYMRSLIWPQDYIIYSSILVGLLVWLVFELDSLKRDKK